MTITHWKIANAQTAGRGHLKSNIPCQDYTYSMQENGLTILLLADGAGYAKHSHKGAEAVVKKTASLLADHFDEYFTAEDDDQLKRVIIRELHEEIKMIEGFEGDIKQYASTLLFIAIKGDQYVAGHIGDGLIGKEQDGELKVFSFPENGQFVNTTFFVTSEDAWKHFRLYKGLVGTAAGFVLMSDGTAESLFNKKEERLAPAITRMFEWLRDHPSQKISAVLANNLDAVIKEQTHDDCSIAIASLVTLDPEVLLAADNEYLRDFMGTHSRLPDERKPSNPELGQEIADGAPSE
ncbi:PP2C family serine/threonine-protein phosphatase [Mesobacillus harenae]|uniref:PP2C family serine/threonine-protein phosphatase n=1 Tax=Mesobacillus harenae TaxID=2213203 RepID=UPI00157FD875|nr:PP2C family serine/threonine-protein phosphatase [Mesobacillus harenae]